MRLLLLACGLTLAVLLICERKFECQKKWGTPWLDDDVAAANVLKGERSIATKAIIRAGSTRVRKDRLLMHILLLLEESGLHPEVFRSLQ